MKTREERRQERYEDIRDTVLGILVLVGLLVVAALEGAWA